MVTQKGTAYIELFSSHMYKLQTFKISPDLGELCMYLCDLYCKIVSLLHKHRYWPCPLKAELSATLPYLNFWLI